MLGYQCPHRDLTEASCVTGRRGGRWPAHHTGIWSIQDRWVTIRCTLSPLDGFGPAPSIHLQLQLQRVNGGERQQPCKWTQNCTELLPSTYMLHCATCLSSSKGNTTYTVIISAWCKNSCCSHPSYAVQQHPRIKRSIEGMGDTSARTPPRTAVPVLLMSCSEMVTNGLHWLFQSAFKNLWL